jgi:hypothetical protein
VTQQALGCSALGAVDGPRFSLVTDNRASE